MENIKKPKKSELQPPVPSPVIGTIDHDIDESSDIYELLHDASALNMLHLLREEFPGYSENYWNEHSQKYQQ